MKGNIFSRQDKCEITFNFTTCKIDFSTINQVKILEKLGNYIFKYIIALQIEITNSNNR